MTTEFAGSCMGFGIRSRMAFRMLRAGTGSPLVVEPWTGPVPQGEELLTWRPRAGNPFHGRLVRLGDRYAFWASDAGWYVIDPSVPSIGVAEPELSLMRELRLFGVPASLCATELGDIPLHASAVEIRGEAILFAGPSLHGKTTLAAAFAARGHRLLSEDTIRCRARPGPVAFPGPAVVRLRADVASHVTMPHALGSETGDGRVPLVFERERRGDGGPVPLRAIFLLHAGPDLALAASQSHAAARDLFALSFRLPGARFRAETFSRIVDLVAGVDVVSLYRPMTMLAMDEVMARVEDYIGRT